jgi:enoyl-CoA hydratase/carnithine racemase
VAGRCADLEAFANDPGLRVLIITGAGDRSFCAGSDLKAKVAGELDVSEEMNRWGYAGIVRHFVNKPVIAAVNGFALGGGTEIALSCDLIVASEHATFGLPEPTHGLLAGAGGLLRLPRQIPLKVAMNCILTGESLSAAEALRWGLVNQVVPHETLIAAAVEMATKICESSPVAIRASKEIVYRGLDQSLDFPGDAWVMNDSYVDIVQAGDDAKRACARSWTSAGPSGRVIVEADGVMRQDFGTLADLIRAHARHQPGHPAIVQDERALDYAALDAAMDRVAASLQRDGLQPGAAIAICARNSLEYATVFLGATRSGITVAPLAPDTRPEGLAAMVSDSDAALLFLDKTVASALQPVASRMTARCIALDNSIVGSRLADWLLPMGAIPRAVAPHPESAFNIIYSSGTTGVPKGIVMPYSFRWAQLKVFSTLGYGTDAVILLAITLYSNMALSAFLPALGMGATVVLMAKFDAGRYLELAQLHRATHSMLVPVQVQRIMQHPDFDRYDLSSFRVKSCASEPFPPRSRPTCSRAGRAISSSTTA